MLADLPLNVRSITEADAASGFRCGKHSLDDYFARHAISNDRAGVSRAFVLPGETEAGDPKVLGYYTLSMALLGSAEASSVLSTRLPRYLVPVALIGRLAVHEHARGRGFGEMLGIGIGHLPAADVLALGGDSQHAGLTRRALGPSRPATPSATAQRSLQPGQRVGPPVCAHALDEGRAPAGDLAGGVDTTGAALLGGDRHKPGVEPRDGAR